MNEKKNEEEEEGEEENYDYGILPPRVVVHEIFSYTLISTTKISNDLDLYGIFKRDRLRNIWFLFTCIRANTSESRILPMMDFSKLIYLNICSRTFSEDFRKLVIVSPKMRFLEELVVFYDSELRSSRKTISTLFSSPGCFPVLMKLEIFNSCLDNLHHNTCIDEWLDVKPIWTRLTKLDFLICGFPNSDFFKKPDYLTNIKILKLDSTTLDELVEIKLEKLEELYLSGCTNLKIIPGGHLKEIFLTDIPSELIEPLFSGFRDLEAVNICYYLEETSFKNDFLCLRGYSGRIKKHLVLEGIHGIESPLDLSNSLESLEIGNSHAFDEIVLYNASYNMNNLISVRLRELSVSLNHELMFCTNLKKLMMSGIIALSTDFFHINTWDCLEELSLDDMKIPTGKWLKMPNLKTLSISYWRNKNEFSEIEFFPDEGFPLLEIINLETSGLENFEVEKSMEKQRDVLISLKTKVIKNIEIIDVVYLYDEYFTKPENFEFAESIDISENQLLTGENWARMENIKRIVFLQLKNFGDGFFFSNTLVNATSLSLSDLPLLEGKNWHKMFNPSQIKILNLQRLPRFCEDIFMCCEWTALENLSIGECGKLKGIGWNGFHVLKELHIMHIQNKRGKKIRGIFNIDGFFKEHKEITNTLENVLIRHCHENFSGKGLGGNIIFSRLKSLELAYCDSFKDEFFIENKFPKLEYLHLTRLKLIEGIGWSLEAMGRSLRKVDFCECEQIKDCLFQGNVFENVVELGVSDCEDLEGKEWRFIPKLITFTGGGEVFENPNFERPFPRTCTLFV